MRSGVFQKGREPSCMSTSLPRLPTSAPGPPPRVRVVSGLAQAARYKTRAATVINAKRISHSLSREDDDQAKNKAPNQDQRGGRGRVTIAEPFPATVQRRRN